MCDIILQQLYEATIDGLPATASPDVFGLHYNAHIGYSTNAVKDMWSVLIMLQPRMVSSGTGITTVTFLIYLLRLIITVLIFMLLVNIFAVVSKFGRCIS